MRKPCKPEISGKKLCLEPSFADNQWEKNYDAVQLKCNLEVMLTSAHLFGIIRRASLRSASVADSVFSNRGVMVALGLIKGQGSLSLLPR